MQPAVPQSDLDRDRLIQLKRDFRKWAESGGEGSFGWSRAVLGRIDLIIGRENRNKFLTDCFGREIETSKELTSQELFAVCMWAVPTKSEIPGGVTYSDVFHHDLEILQTLYQHQIRMPGVSE